MKMLQPILPLSSSASAPAAAGENAPAHLLHLALEHAPYGICFVDGLGRAHALNRTLKNWLNRPLRDVCAMPLARLFMLEDQPLFEQALKRVMDGSASYQDAELRLQYHAPSGFFEEADAAPRWVAVSMARLPQTAASLAEAVAQPGQVVVYMADITRRKATEQEWMTRATTDHLTGVANRMVFDAALHKALTAAQRYARSGAVLYVDIDDFKGVNDTYGHKAGDAMLRAIGTALQTVFRESDVIARIGGDEFAIIMEEVSKAEAYEKARQLEQEIETITVRAHNQMVGCAVSVGVHVFGGPQASQRTLHDTLEAILAQADAAMYAAKASRKRRLNG